ncbi:hypothetical protein BGX31_010024 [Mortierella sp. GBA43]|nr:hypothetical protein BGX31_010024 [Mortierella sp. GBA43]
MFVLGGQTTAGQDSLQAFMIDLTKSWNASTPAYQVLPEGPRSEGYPSAMTADGNWVSIVNDTCYVYNVAAKSWKSILTNSNFSVLPSGHKATADPDTGLVYIPYGYGPPLTRLMVELNINTKTFKTSAMPTAIQGLNLFMVAWSAVNKVMVFVAPIANGIYQYSPTQGWKNLATKGDVPPIRRTGCLASFDGGKKMVLTGGYSPFTSTTLGDIYILDMASLTWKAGPNITNEYTTDTLVYNLTTNTWTNNYVAPYQSPSQTHTSNVASGTAPVQVPTDVPSDSGGDVSRLGVILGSSVGALALALIGGVLGYRSRAKKVKRTIHDPHSSHKDDYPDNDNAEDLGYIPPPRTTPYPYPLPPGFPEPGNPTLTAEPQYQYVYAHPVGKDTSAMGRPHAGTYGAHPPQNPQALVGSVGNQGFMSEDMYEMQNVSQQAFISRRNPIETGPFSEYHESDKSTQGPHANIERSIDDIYVSTTPTIGSEASSYTLYPSQPFSIKNDK